MRDKWEKLISEFRRLGGTANNVCQKDGEYGRGIFSIDSKLQSRIFIPTKLMIKKEDIILENNKLRIKKQTQYSDDIMNFFNDYQEDFSWGQGGQENVAAFEKDLKNFSSELKELIKKFLLIDINERHNGDWDQIIFREFLTARAFNSIDKIPMICPILELVNHEVNSLTFIRTKEGLSTPFYPPFKGELTHVYNNMSAIKRFFYQGFFSKESIVFSLPFHMQIDKSGIAINCRGQELNNDDFSIQANEDFISIKGLPIADSNNKGLPKSYFEMVIEKINRVIYEDDLLSKINQFNIIQREKFIRELKKNKTNSSKMLREIMEYELEVISSHD